MTFPNLGWHVIAGLDGRQHSKTLPRKIDAEQWLRTEEGRADRGERVDPAAGKITFSVFSETWLEGLYLKPATPANYVSNLKSRVLPTFGNAQQAKITSAQVRVCRPGSETTVFPQRRCAKLV